MNGVSKCEIPKVIHYCWFGGKKLPPEAKKCIASWKKYFPNYEIKEWNESNYDLNCCDYVKEAYQAKKWAFVSDYARFDILYKYGGLYFDTDVEVIRPMDDLIEKGPFMGLESGTVESLIENHDGKVNPGLGIAALPELPLYKEIIDGYKNRHFLNEKGDPDIFYTICFYVSDILSKKEIIEQNGIGYSSGIYIYPKDYFCPKDYETGFLNLTQNSRSIHHYSATWITPVQQKIHDIEKKYTDKYGDEIGMKKSKKTTFVYRIVNKIQTKGLVGTMKFLLKKL